jgi:hypothetical protein
MPRTAATIASAALLAVLAAAGFADAQPAPRVHSAAKRVGHTLLISKSVTGGVPNGPSTKPVISGDRRYVRVIAFQSEASDIVRGDTNQLQDVFAIKRGGTIDNSGSPWKPGKTLLLSRGTGGQPANGPSFDPAVDGDFHNAPRCVVFLSAASNLVKGDTNGAVDAFVSRGPGGAPVRVSLPSARRDTTAVTVSGDCSRIAFVTGGRLYTRVGGKTHRVSTSGAAADPSFAAGASNDLVFGAKGGVYLSSGGTGHPKLIAAGGRNPGYNDLKRRVVAYEKRKGGHWQLMWRDLGKGEHVASAFKGQLGNGDSSNPVVTNSGYYIGFDSKASNLGTGPSLRQLDHNGHTDTYLRTDVRKITIVESVAQDGHPLPGGGRHVSVSYYANYILFDSPAPLGSRDAPHQVFMRYLGGI